MLQIVVFGAGAIGSVYGAKLSSAHDVTLVAREAHAREISTNGLRIAGVEDGTYAVHAVTALSAIAPDTLVIFATKVSDSEVAARSLAPLVRPDTVILCVQNGLYSEDVVKAVVGDRCRVLRAITHVGAIFRTPGVVELKVRSYTAIENSPVSAAIADALTACGLDGRVTDRIKEEMWRKLVVNCVINPINAITRTEVGAIADERLTPLKRLIVDECVSVARRDGVALEGDLVAAIDAQYGASRNLSSMQQDLLKGRRTEIDFLNGAVVRLGERYGIACPVNAALATIIRRMEETR
ncbi:MAG: 2-dehydropantoate 2-reductase [Acidobacteria bacterium]|nr:2-dehydropantoate 2-reductase [Acidobacteriota bacterium]